MGGTIRIAHTNVGQFWDPIYVLEPFLDGGFKFPFEYGCDTHGLQFVLVPSRLMSTPLSQSRTNKLFKTDRSILLSFSVALTLSSSACMSQVRNCFIPKKFSADSREFSAGT
jgi:hypothetical protein